jgi:hypothetical protein
MIVIMILNYNGTKIHVTYCGNNGTLMDYPSRTW